MALIGHYCSTETLDRHFLRNLGYVSAALAVLAILFNSDFGPPNFIDFRLLWPYVAL